MVFNILALVVWVILSVVLVIEGNVSLEDRFLKRVFIFKTTAVFVDILLGIYGKAIEYNYATIFNLAVTVTVIIFVIVALNQKNFTIPSE